MDKAKDQHSLKLLRVAEDFCQGQMVTTITHLYRNKSREYFDQVLNKEDGLMLPYKKDYGGDPSCPINGRLKGLFFAATLVQGRIPEASPFGNTRLTLPVEELIEPDTNLYFADFFCMPIMSINNNHYIVLVVTKQGSPADLFCNTILPQININNNLFLTRRAGPNGPSFTIPFKTGFDHDGRPHKLWIEVMYTEAIDMANMLIKYGDAIITTCRTFGEGSSKKETGVRKHTNCTICSYNPCLRCICCKRVLTGRDFDL